MFIRERRDENVAQTFSSPLPRMERPAPPGGSSVAYFREAGPTPCVLSEGPQREYRTHREPGTRIG